jgi:hypothetical protein
MRRRKKKMKSQLVLSALVALALSGCANGGNPQTGKSFNIASIKAGIAAGTTTPQESAEEMALAAEQLAQSTNAVYALRLAKASLELDPSNVRAKFWSAALAPAMELKGFVTRLEPIAKATPRRYRGYLKFKNDIEQGTPVKAVRDFFLKGPKDIRSEDEIQDTISAVTLRMEELRQTLKSLKGEELTVYRNPETITDMEKWESAQRSCSASSENGTITLHGCDISAAYQVKLNGADFEVMQQAIAGYQVYIGAMNSYSFHGAINAAEMGKMNPANTLEVLLADPKFGTLRDGRNLAVIPEIAVDAALGARSAIQLQQELCAKQGGQTWTRPGYAFGSGSCELPDDGFEAALKTIEALAQGPANVVFHVDGQNKNVKMDIPAFTKAPPADVRTLRLSSNGHCTSIGDKTLGGLFPNGDFDQLADCP